jgi:hypothetical protein
VGQGGGTARPIINANWTATDGLGRSLPGHAEVGPPQPERFVGLFYWQWHGQARIGKEYDVTRYLESHPKANLFEVNPPGGPKHPEWFWAEPLFGYYRAADPWVIRKHLIAFAHAGVDFLFLDYTNASVYDAELTAMLEQWGLLRKGGVAAPRLLFFLNHQPEWKIEHLYKNYYLKPAYADAWFRWQGKPLVLSPKPTANFKDPALLKPVQEFFTWRPTWALFDSKTAPTRWRFMDVHEQRPALDDAGKVEQLAVAKSMGGPLNNNMKIGCVSCVPGVTPTFDAKWLTPDTARGLFFEKQWKVAQAVHPKILLVTGWNEWKASVWNRAGVPFLGRVTAKDDPYGYFVDEFNMEFNRDLEPMKGGYEDAYYWQFVAELRRYKGLLAPETPSLPTTIAVDGDFADWADVAPFYADAHGDVIRRNFASAVSAQAYTDDSARNDLSGALTAYDADYLYFGVRTAAPLSPSSDKNWMLLLVDTDRDPKTGFAGFDFLINRSRDGRKMSVERNVGGAWTWERVGEGTLAVSADSLELSVPRELLGIPRGEAHYDFKWADNLPESPTVMDFWTSGDVAPDTRFRYQR